MVLKLTRFYFPDGTNGKLEVDNVLICFTIELPWLDNKNRVSCIPEGNYYLRKRYSDKFNWHIGLLDVMERKFILFHPANNALKELKGCIGPVTQHCGNGCGVQSRKAFLKLRALVFKAIDLEQDVLLIIES
jgi:hypothetical protein